MKVTEQLDAMAVSGVNAFNYTVVTRVLATTLMVPILVFYADGIGLIGAWVGMNLEGDMTMRLFMQKVVAATDFPDIFSSLFKSVLFGFAIGIVGCYKGYNAPGRHRRCGAGGQLSRGGGLISDLYHGPGGRADYPPDLLLDISRETGDIRSKRITIKCQSPVSCLTSPI